MGERWLLVVIVAVVAVKILLSIVLNILMCNAQVTDRW